eukprot:1143611-Pelagomonas_calceolata.AAC.7
MVTLLCVASTHFLKGGVWNELARGCLLQSWLVYSIVHAAISSRLFAPSPWGAAQSCPFSYFLPH